MQRRAVLFGVVVAMVAAGLLAGCEGRDGRQKVEASGGARAMAPASLVGGDRIHVLEDSLPPGVRFLDEGPRQIGEQETVLARFAATDGLWDGDGPYLRVIVHRDPGVAERFDAAAVQGSEPVTIQGHPGTYDVDESSDPQTMDLPAAMAQLQNPWTSVGWATGPDELIVVQAKGISQADLLAVADGLVVDA